MWDSRDTAQHYEKKDWPVRQELVPYRAENIINNPLVDRDRILFPPLHKTWLDQAIYQSLG